MKHQIRELIERLPADERTKLHELEYVQSASGQLAARPIRRYTPSELADWRTFLSTDEITNILADADARCLANHVD